MAQSDAEFIDDFKLRLTTPLKRRRLSTSIKGLDKILDGGLCGDSLYIIGSASSVGKTSLILQIAESIAKQGFYVLIFSLEMSRESIIAKQLSRISFIKSGGDEMHSGTTLDFMNGNYKTYKCHGDTIELNEVDQQLKMNNMEKSVAEYAESANQIFVCDGGKELNSIEIITEELEVFVEQGLQPIVIIDYLQLLTSKDGRKSEKQALDENITILKKIARAYRLAIIAVSSFNRESYEKSANMSSWKESGAIEYGADVLMALQYSKIEEQSNKTKTKEKIMPIDINEEKRKNPRMLDLVILKNRNGEAGGKIKLQYYCANNYFKETE